MANLIVFIVGCLIGFAIVQVIRILIWGNGPMH
jgi:hypothetical protein